MVRALPAVIAIGLLQGCSGSSAPEIVQVLVRDDEVEELPGENGSPATDPDRERRYVALPADYVTVDFRVPKETVTTVKLLGATLAINPTSEVESSLYADCKSFVRLARRSQGDADGLWAWRATVRMPKNVENVDSRPARMAVDPYEGCRGYDPNRGVPLVLSNIGTDKSTPSPGGSPRSATPASPTPGGDVSEEVTTIRLLGRTLPLTVFSLNFNGMGTCTVDVDPCPGRYVSYADKARRIVDWFKAKQVKPDIIALQEVHGYLVARFSQCYGRTESVPDWLMEHLLIDWLQRDVGESYRVAYLTGKKWFLGPGGRCHFYGAQTVLYRSATLTNETVNQARNLRNEEYDAKPLKYPHLRRSLPVCGPVADLGLVSSRLDGEVRESDCGSNLITVGSVRSPAGPAFAIFGSDRGEAHIVGTAVEFSFTASSDARIMLFNVHANSGHSKADQAYMEDLVGTVAGKRRGTLYYPPIMTGDLNDIYKTLPGDFRYPFENVTPFREHEQMMTYIGDSDYWLSVQTPTRDWQWAPSNEGGCPPSAETRISDHCGLLTHFR